MSVVVGVSYDVDGWPVFRLKEMPDLLPETVESYRKRIEDALNEEPFDWRGLRGEILAGDLYLFGPDERLSEDAVREVFEHYAGRESAEVESLVALVETLLRDGQFYHSAIELDTRSTDGVDLRRRLHNAVEPFRRPRGES